MEAYLILKVLWWLLLGVLLMGLAIMVGMDMGVGHHPALCRAHRCRASRGAEHHWTALGWQPGVVRSGRRRNLRCLAAGLCHRVLGVLRRHAAAAVEHDRSAFGIRVSQQARISALAQRLGLVAVRQRFRTHARVRRCDRQHPARRAVSLQLEPDIVLHRQLRRPVQPICDPVRPAFGRDVGVYGRGNHHEWQRRGDLRAGSATLLCGARWPRRPCSRSVGSG